MSTCTHCPADIVWARTPTGKAMPLDAEPTDNGNVWLLPTPVNAPRLSQPMPGCVVSYRGYFPPRGATRHVHHVTTCPRASEWSPSTAKQRGRTPDRKGRPTKSAGLF